MMLVEESAVNAQLVAAYGATIEQFSDPRWRVENLYTIVDDVGNKIPFRMNAEQEELFDTMWYWNIILKARQMGFSTLIGILALDQCLWVPNTRAGIIAQTEDDVLKLFKNKIQKPYMELPKSLRERIGLKSMSKTEITLGNGSSLQVGMSMRSDTLTFLWVSEFGKICAKAPDRAKEVVTGAFPTLAVGNPLFVESTAEGQCYDDQTEVLTDRGWMFFKDLAKADRILSMDQETKVAYYESNWRHIAHHWTGPMVRFATRTVNLLVTPNHMMWAARQRGPMRLQVASSMLTSVTDFYFERNFNWDAPGIESVTIPSYEHIQGNGIRCHSDKVIPIGVWLKYLGFFLADGHVSWRNGCKQVVLTQTKFVSEFRDAAQAMAAAMQCNLMEQNHENGKRFTLANAQLADYLRHYTQPKCIPRDLLMTLSKQQCRDLIDSIYMGDGCQTHRNRDTEMDYGRIFAGVDKPFQDDIQELALKAGYATSSYGRERNRTATFTESVRAMVGFRNPPAMVVGHDGMVYCVSLPKDHLLMVRRGGTAVWCGNSGYFHDYVMEAKKAADTGRKLSQRSFKLHFYAWWQKNGNRLDPETVEFGDNDHLYFDKLLAERGIMLDEWQKAWYVNESHTLKGDMHRENPSYPEEAFAAALKGAYYEEEMLWMRKHNRITSVPWDPTLPVNTFWDFGVSTNNETTIWFHQRNGKQDLFIEYYEEGGKGLGHFAKYLQSTGYLFGTHFLPHDANARMQTEGEEPETRLEILERLLRGHRFEVVGRVADITNGIELTRERFPTCWMDRERCAKGISALDCYVRTWNKQLGQFTKVPFHNWASNGADSFRQFGQGYHPSKSIPSSAQKPPKQSNWRVV